MARPASVEQHRLRALVEAGIALSSEHSLDALRQRLVEPAASLTGTRHAALIREATPLRLREIAAHSYSVVVVESGEGAGTTLVAEVPLR